AGRRRPGVDERGVPGAHHAVPALPAVHRTGGRHSRSARTGRRTRDHRRRGAGRGGVMTRPAALGTMTLQAMIEHADVLHRLALAVDCLDAVTRHRVATGVRIGREVPQEVLPRGHDPAWPCWNLIAKGTGRATIMLDLRAPTTVRLRIVDPRRRYVA